MPWSDWIYTAPAAATDAYPGKVIASADWNAIFTDLQTALNQLAQHTVATAVNFNAVGDTAMAITLPTGFTRYTLGNIRISGASASLTTAQFGLFTAASGGGTAIISGGTAITVSTASDNTNNNAMIATPSNANTQSFTAATLYFRVTNAEGSAATAGVTLVYTPLP
jgi:hypothetical protein